MKGHIMKVIINNDFGGFGVKHEIMERLGYQNEHDWDLRTDERLIKMVEDGKDVGDDYSALVICTLPDNTTDWDISDYDGMETLLYVVDGKICYYNLCDYDNDDEQ